MANSSEPRKGTGYFKQVSLTSQASEPFHAVRNDDPALLALRASGIGGTGGSTSGFVSSGYGAEYFGNKDPITNGHSTVANGAAVLINELGRLTAATSVSSNAFNTFAVKAGNRYYFKGMIAFAYGNNLVPGKDYWLQLSGNPSVSVPSQPGEWAIKVGIAINSTDLLVMMDTQGQIN